MDLSSGVKKLSCYRPGQPFGLQKVEAPRTSKQSAREGGSLSALCAAKIYHQDISLILISVQG